MIAARLGGVDIYPPFPGRGHAIDNQDVSWQHRPKIINEPGMHKNKSMRIGFYFFAFFTKYSKSIFLSLFIILVLSVLILLNRNHILNPWQVQEIKQVQPELGLAYSAQTTLPSLSSHNKPSLAKVLENGRPLPGPGNSQHSNIRRFGNGSYSFWHDYVLFSSSDNSSPVTNGRSYSITYPIIVSDLLAYSVYAVLILLLLVNAWLGYIPEDSFQNRVLTHWVAINSLKTIVPGRPVTMKYRPEIDGLRAVAVLSVILFHAGFKLMRGGYVGVDIFFVISGYLITTIIINELDEGRFSIAGFYERRARRILPALFLVLACSVPIAFLLLLPDQLISFSKSLGWVMTFVSNLYFRSEINYFARASEEEPLLHTWSLAVEEQFYLVFPLLLLLLWKISRNLFIAIMLLIALASFLFAESLSLLEPGKAFFDTRLRIWELLIGSMVAIYLILRWRKAEMNRSIAEVGSALGLGLITWAILYFEKSTPFPGRHALAPTLGAALIIVCASQSTYAGRLLSWKPLVGIGLISYSAYLWHQPIFAFARLSLHERPSSFIFSCLSILSLLLAYLSWRFVEKPFRNKEMMGRKMVFTLSITGMAIFGCVAVLGSVYKGLPWRFPESDADLIVSFKERGNYVCSLHQSYAQADNFDSKNGVKWLIIGDSFSQDLVNILHEGKLLQNAEIKTWNIPARCQLYQGDESLANFIKPGDIELCSRDYYQGLRELIAAADIVLIAAKWQKWSVERLKVTLDRLGIRSKANYIVFGPKGFGHINLTSYARMSLSERAVYINPVSESIINLNQILSETLDSSHFVDVQALLCNPTKLQCHIFNEQGLLLSHDGGHLTQAGARYLGSRLADVPAFARLIKAVER